MKCAITKTEMHSVVIQISIELWFFSFASMTTRFSYEIISIIIRVYSNAQALPTNKASFLRKQLLKKSMMRIVNTIK